jgi:hypothetical protein
MRKTKNVFRSLSRRPRVVAAALFFLFLSILAFAASPALHELIHADAKDVHHQCAITVLAHGQVDAPACEVSAPVPTVCFELFSPVTASFASPILEQFPPGRAPPFRT